MKTKYALKLTNLHENFKTFTGSAPGPPLYFGLGSTASRPGCHSLQQGVELKRPDLCLRLAKPRLESRTACSPRDSDDTSEFQCEAHGLQLSSN